jgi:DNA-binding NarL/FixJ family response regulator
MFCIQRRFAAIRSDGGCLAESSVRILVVDDFEPWRQQLCSILQIRPEFRVVAEVGDGLEAVQKARELKPDLILLDIGLPNLNGIGSREALPSRSRCQDCLFDLPQRDRDVARAALSAGAQGYVLKTDPARELLTAVQKVLGGEHFVSSGIQAGNSGETEEAQCSPDSK